MTRAGNLLHEFLPVDEMFDCAEAIIRVFHRLGDYKHKQKNRLKFLVKSLGWDGFRTEYERERAELALAATSRCRSIPSGRPSRRRRPGRERRALSLEEIAARATATAGDRSGHRAQGRAAADGARPRSSASGRAPTCGRRSRMAISIVIVTTRAGRPDVGADAAARRARRRSSATARSASRWTRTCCSAGCATENVEAFYKSLAAAGLARARRRDARPTSRAARARSRASSRSRSRAGSAACSPITCWSARTSSAALPGHGHQNQRLPERLRSASHRRASGSREA